MHTIKKEKWLSKNIRSIQLGDRVNKMEHNLKRICFIKVMLAHGGWDEV